jgi:hypothetical protein
MTKLQSALLATATFALGAVAVSALHAQSNAPYHQVEGINVTDQAGYEASGVDKVRDAIKAAGGKVIAGGYTRPSPSTVTFPLPIASDLYVPEQGSGRQGSERHHQAVGGESER